MHIVMCIYSNNHRDDVVTIYDHFHHLGVFVGSLTGNILNNMHCVHLTSLRLDTTDLSFVICMYINENILLV